MVFQVRQEVVLVQQRLIMSTEWLDCVQVMLEAL
jgi:hypothetical protein